MSQNWLQRLLFPAPPPTPVPPPREPDPSPTLASLLPAYEAALTAAQPAEPAAILNLLLLRDHIEAVRQQDKKADGTAIHTLTELDQHLRHRF